MEMKPKISLLGLVLLLIFTTKPAWTNRARAQEQVTPSILFTSNRSGHWDVYTMAPDGSQGQVLSETLSSVEGEIIQADLSPDRRQLLFSVHRNWQGEEYMVTGEIFLLDLETNVMTQITTDKQNSQYPLWSPDSTHFSYLTGGGLNGFAALHIVELASMDRQEFPRWAFTPPGAITLTLEGMDWSPDMQHLVLNTFDSPPGSWQLFIFGATGALIDSSTPVEVLALSPRWSADANIIYFICDDPKTICAFDIQTSAIQHITEISEMFSEYRLENLDVSRDGQVAFELRDLTTGARDIYLYTLAGDIINLTEGSNASNKNPRWIYDDDLPPMDFARLTCKSALPPRLKVGDRAYVIDLQTGSNIVRSSAGRDMERIGMALVNSAMTILDGPVCIDDLVWYQVQLDDGLIGWTAEGEFGDYYLGRLPK